MLDIRQLSESKQALLEKYLRGERSQAVMTDAISRRTDEGPFPLSLAQQQIWLHSQFVPDVPLYNEPITIRIPGQINAEVLRQALNAFIRRHAAWRTSFPLVNGQPVQKIHAEFELDMPFVDLRHLPAPAREAEAVRLATTQATPLFDLTQLPLLRAILIQLDDEDYRLFLCLHHIIFDGYIYEIFLPELYTLYEANLHNSPSPLSPLPIEYSDYSIWQREQSSGPVFTEQLAYWKKQLANAPEALELPTDHVRPAIQSGYGSKEVFELSRSLTKKLKDLSNREGVSFYMLLMASFDVLLNRYTGQNDILVATTIAGRDRKEIQGVMGLFLNTLVLRTDLTGNPTFRELLERVREVILEAHANRHVPFEYVVQETQATRDLARNPLAQVLFSLEPPLPVLESGWTITLSDVAVHTSKYDLYFNLDDRPDGFAAWIEYNTDIYDAATIKRMVEHWQTLLSGIVRDPDLHISELPLLTKRERKQLLVEWNNTQAPYPIEQCVHQLFEAQVERTPEATAVVCAEGTLSYRELNQKANQLAHHLQQRGVGPDQLVGLCLDRSLDMMVALLGTLKAGGAYVPLDPAYPPDRIAYMLHESQTSLLLTQHDLLEQLPQERPDVICIDTDWSQISQEDTSNVESEVNAGQRMYVIYTSGSTGRPKGVQILHRAVTNFLFSMQHDLKISEEDTLLAVTTLSFDIAVLELFLPLVTGARLRLERREVTADGARLAAKIMAQHPTIMQATPATWRMLLDANIPDFHQLQILCGGEAMPQDLRDQLAAKEPAVIWNLYGPTETTIWSTMCQIVPEQDEITIGRPIANTQIYILDTHKQPVPIGILGELYIGGAGLARGYLNQPAITAEKFVHNPFSNDPASRLYRSGDLVRYLADGRIEFQGRLDHQVKIRGFRIELGEIETTLKLLPTVNQAVVIAREDIPGDKRLVAYITKACKLVPTQSDLREMLQRHLPEYMVPSAFVLLDELPLTPNGKTDRRALPAPDTSRSTDTFVPPKTQLHYQLLAIWEELLNVQPIGIQDNFFLLGGHSLLATRLISKIEQTFHKQVSLSSLFKGPTIARLADVLEEQGDTGPRSPITPIQVQGAKAPFFFLHGDYRNGAFYCYPLAHHLGADQPFYALEPYDFSGQQEAPSFDTIIKAQIELIRSVQPEGPYQLGGFCDGGLTAYEIARQLRQRGEQVNFLVLIDSAYPPLLHKVMHSALNRAGKLIGLSPAQQLECFLRLRHTYKYLRNQRKLTDFDGLNALDPSIHTLTPHMAVLREEGIPIFEWAIAAYGYQSYPGKVTLFRCSEEPFDKTWQRKAAHEQNIEVATIPGTHETCRTDHIQDLAEQLKKGLAQAQP